MKFKFRTLAFIYLILSPTLNGLILAGVEIPGFIENKGQIMDQSGKHNSEVLFLYAGNGLKIQLRKTGFSYELFVPEELPQSIEKNKFSCTHQKPQIINVRNHRIDLDFVGIKSLAEIEPAEQSTDYLNYYLNGKEMTGIHSYGKVMYKNIFPNTDIEFVLTKEGQKTNFKYNIILRPGADIHAIKFLVKGAEQLKLTDHGSVCFTTSLGTIAEKIPYSYYLDHPTQNKSVNFILNRNTISFSADYDPSKTLVIDPSSNLIWSTYYGDTQQDYGYSTGCDGQENVYMTGHTMSTANIATSGAYQTVFGGVIDVFLVKFNANGVRQWATYFGGNNVDQAFAMHVETNGDVYIAGDTFSTSDIASPGAHQTVYGGGIDDALLAKFNTAGQRVWSTYYGGLQHDIAQAIAIDRLGNVYITGHTESTNNIATPGAYNTTYIFNYDAFVAKFSNNGVLLWGTYYGDAATDEAYGLTCDTLNAVYVTGVTQSLGGISTMLAHQTSFGGFQDAFLAKFDPTGTNLVWGTYYGGQAIDFGITVKANKTGLIFLGGGTASSSGISTPGAYQPNPASVDDVFLVCFNTAGQRQWGTYFGGSDVDYINDMVLDWKSNLIFCGTTLSTNSISTTGAYQPSIGLSNTYDGYFAKFSATGQRKLGSYFGGSGSDNARSIALGNSGKVYLAGETTSSVGISTPGAFKTNLGGAHDAFLANFCISYEPKITPSGSFTVCPGPSTITAPAGFYWYVWNSGITTNPLVVNTTTQTGTYYFSVTVTDSFGCSGISDTTRIVIKDCVIGYEERVLNEELKIFPSPAQDLLCIEVITLYGKEAFVELISAEGQCLKTSELQNGFLSFNLQNLSSGIYLIRLHSGDKITSKKFVKQ